MAPAFADPSIARAGAGVLAAGAVAALAWRAGSLAPSGAVAATGVGAAAVVGGWRWGGLLISYFVLASALSRWRRAAKAARTAGVVEKGGRRDAAQVLANGAAFGAVAAAGGLLGASGRAGAVLAGAAAGALAAAAADTWATEVGTAVGGAPRLVAGWRPWRWPVVPAGTSGAVSAAGSLALVAGAVATAAGAGAFGLPAAAVVGAVTGGVAGAWADTLAGAAVQERRWCDACAAATEQRVHTPCGQATRVRGGVAGLGNDGVNGLCTVAGGAAGAAAGGLTHLLAGALPSA